MNDHEFLSALRESFKEYLSKDSSRSTAKLIPLHGKIASDLMSLYGEQFTVSAQGINSGREKEIIGRYYPKKVDIVVEKDKTPVAGYSVKFVMRNYSQNSNNYFENMLGETANIRTKKIPYFQIFVIFEKVPYYKKGGEFSRFDVITEHNLEKYLALGDDNPEIYYHTPDRTLFVLLHLKETPKDKTFANSTDYANHYLSIIDDEDLITYSTKIEDTFGSSVLLNRYTLFLQKSHFLAIGKMKD